MRQKVVHRQFLNSDYRSKRFDFQICITTGRIEQSYGYHFVRSENNPPHLQIARLIRQRDWCSNGVHLAIAMIERAYCFVMEQVTVSLPFIAEGDMG